MPIFIFINVAVYFYRQFVIQHTNVLITVFIPKDKKILQTNISHIVQFKYE